MEEVKKDDELTTETKKLHDLLGPWLSGNPEADPMIKLIALAEVAGVTIAASQPYYHALLLNRLFEAYGSFAVKDLVEFALRMEKSRHMAGQLADALLKSVSNPEGKTEH